MQRLGRKEWARRFSTKNLAMLIGKGFGMTEIIEDVGFRSVARAIRDATVTELWRRRREEKQRDVRFGLAQKWKQKMRASEHEFASAVAEFVQDYNWETANRLGGRGHSVTTNELDALVRLIQGRAELVGSLLLAFGFAWERGAEPTEPESQTTTEA
jgi:hypothetical protein